VKKHYPDQKLGFINLEGCMTAKVMALGLEKAGKDLTREGLIRTFENMKDVDAGGAVINMSAEDHQAFGDIFLTQIKDGRITQIKTIGK
jgi:branched-chain amino acid transport system substrate-binding protein